MLSDYQHPITYQPTGDVARDYRHSSEVFEATLTPHLPPDKGAPILDVGCGWGQFLWWLREKGYAAARGIDVGLEQERHCRSIGLDVECVADSKKFLLDHPGRFELIGLHHVIEHMPVEQGVEVLRAARAALRDGGRIIVQTPNMSSVSAGYTRHIEITHVTGYSETSLHEALSLAGFRVTDLFGNKTPLRLTPRRLLWRALQTLSTTAWGLMLTAELGSDRPRVLQKNLFAVGVKGE